jgi:hypothetical protein
MFPLLLAACLAAHAKAPTSVTLLKDKVDLDGNGRSDKILVVASEGDLQAVNVTVGTTSLADNQLYVAVSARVVDLDDSDDAHQIVVEGTSEGGKRWFTFFVWDGRKVVQALKVTTDSEKGGLSTPGGGTVILESDRGFFLQRSAWTVGGTMFQPVLQPFIHVGATATANEATDLVTDPGSADRVTQLAAGAEAQVLLMTREEPYWYLVRAPNGLVGWVRSDTIGAALQVEPLP